MQLSWVKCQGEVWCMLGNVNLAHGHFDNMRGVYVIWHAGATPATVYVGSGFIRDRLTFHRTSPEVQAFSNLGLYVTWASVPETSREGVESFLANALKPKVGQARTNTLPIDVNLPWS